MYAKMINEGQIERAPKNKGSWVNFDKNIILMQADGYLPVVVIEEPTAEKPIVKYREVNGQIEQYAEAAPVPSVPEAEDREQSDSFPGKRRRFVAEARAVSVCFFFLLRSSERSRI